MASPAAAEFTPKSGVPGVYVLVKLLRASTSLQSESHASRWGWFVHKLLRLEASLQVEAGLEGIIGGSLADTRNWGNPG